MCADELHYRIGHLIGSVVGALVGGFVGIGVAFKLFSLRGSSSTLGMNGGESSRSGKGSIRKSDYPSRTWKATTERLENGAKDIEGNINCQNCNKRLAPGEGTPEHKPSLVETHNQEGFNTDQATRIRLFNETATEWWCGPCQKRQGGKMTDTYRRDVGPDYKPRPPKSSN